MPQRLIRRVTIEVTHLWIDFSFFVIGIIGAWQAAAAFTVLDTVENNMSTLLLALQMVSLAICSFLCFAWHYTGKLFQEMLLIIPVVLGALTIAVGYILTGFRIVPETHFMVGVEGLGLGIVLYCAITILTRLFSLYKTYVRLRTSRRIRIKSEEPINMKEIRAVANAVAEESDANNSALLASKGHLTDAERKRVKARLTCENFLAKKQQRR